MAFSLSSLPSQAEIEAVLADVQTILGDVDKFDSFFPASVKTGLLDAEKVLTLLQSVAKDI
jgi:hypothetical protein